MFGEVTLAPGLNNQLCALQRLPSFRLTTAEGSSHGSCITRCLKTQVASQSPQTPKLSQKTRTANARIATHYCMLPNTMQQRLRPICSTASRNTSYM